MAHTKGEWESFNHYVWTKDKQNIASCKNVQDGNPITQQESYDNAQRIVTCVNSHDDLLEACKQAKNEIRIYLEACEENEESSRIYNLLHQAINKAEGR